MKHEMTNKEYNEYVKTKTPNSKLFSNCLKAFVSGGIICVIGHFILTMFKKWGLDTEAASTATSIILVFAGALLTGLDIYPKIAKFAGAGTIVPITGFANSVVSPLLLRQKPKVWCSVSVQKFSQSPVPLSFTVHLPRSLPVLCIGL